MSPSKFYYLEVIASHFHGLDILVTQLILSEMIHKYWDFYSVIPHIWSSEVYCHFFFLNKDVMEKLSSFEGAM